MVKESACQCRRPGFHLWVGKIPWRRKSQRTPAFFPGKSHGLKEPSRLQSMGSQRVRHDLATKQQKMSYFTKIFLTRFAILPVTTSALLYRVTEKAMAPRSSTLAWRIPWTEEPGRLQSMGSRRVGHDWATSLSLFTFMHWRRKWQPTPVFLPGESQGWGSLVGCRLWGRTESDTADVT